MFRFAVPENFGFLILLPLLGGFLYWGYLNRREALLLFAAPGILSKLRPAVQRGRILLKAASLVAGLLFLTLALTRPQYGTRLQTVQREGQDIVVALDVSLSMTAEDIAPSRLEKAKHAIGSLIELLEGDRVGLIAFAGEAFVQCPLTLDYGAARMFLNAMSPGLLPTPGTAVGEAIGKAIQLFEGEEGKQRILLIITDGEDHEGNPVELARQAADNGIVIYTVGIGSPSGAPIPVYDENGRRLGLKKDRSGEVVVSSLDEATLQRIAEASGGDYFRSTPGEDELGQIYSKISEMEQRTLATREFTQFDEQFQWFLGVGILLILIEFLVPAHRRTHGVWKGRFQ